jgi:hypothetical protein
MGKFVCFSVVFLFLFSCKKEQSSVVLSTNDLTTGYFGDISGNYSVFDVTHIVHDEEVDVHDTSQFVYKMYIGDTISENDGTKAKKYIRYNWNVLTAQWDVLDVWKIKRDKQFGVLTEENQSIVKLYFPIQADFSWNANRFNNQDSIYYHYRNVHKSISLNGLLFDSTVIVEQENYFTLVDLKRKKETYAKGIGLISKYYKDLRIKNFDSMKVQKGEEWYFTIKSFGKE